MGRTGSEAEWSLTLRLNDLLIQEPGAGRVAESLKGHYRYQRLGPCGLLLETPGSTVCNPTANTDERIEVQMFVYVNKNFNEHEESSIGNLEK